MTKSLQTACGVPLEFFPAIDGERVPKWKLAKFPEDTTGSAYAVRLTKRLALRRFLQSKKEFLLYLEDDVVVAEDFDETVEEAMGRGHEMVFLGGGHRLPPLGEGRWRKCQHTFNNHALLFSREGARKALSVLRGWKRGWSDQEFQTAMMDGRIEPWCVDPWVAFQRVASSDNFGNTSCVSIAEVAQPFMTGDDLAVLDAALCFSKLVVEYGSGGSTLHIGSRMQNWGKLISVEHNREWYEKVSSALAESDFPVEYILTEPFPLREDDGPMRYLPSQLDNYVAAPQQHVEEGSVDLVFVDGRERIRCALASVKLLKPGGFLMIHDFWPRFRYRAQLWELSQHYEYLFESPGKSDQGGRENPDYQGMAVFRKK